MSLDGVVYAAEVALAKVNVAHEALWRVQESQGAISAAQSELSAALKKLRTEKASAYQVPTTDNPLYQVMLEKNTLAKRCAELEAEVAFLRGEWRFPPTPSKPKKTTRKVRRK